MPAQPISRSLVRAFLLAAVLLVNATAPGIEPSIANALGAPDDAAANQNSVPRAGGPFAGVWTSGPSGVEAAALDDLGVGWARVFVVWASVEPTDGAFDWTYLDNTIALASGNGRRSVLAQVRNNPAWAATNRCAVTNDVERQRLAAFAGSLATRYPGVVWQLYNEEDNTSVAFDTQNDLGGCFGTLAADGTPSADGRVQYALALEAVAAAVRAADPSARVAAGGVASGNFVPNGIFDAAFLPEVLGQLKRDASLDSLDYVTVHYYSSQSGDYAAWGRDLPGRLNKLRADALAAGLNQDDLKPVLSDELSYTSGSGISTADPADIFNRNQAAYVPKVLARAAAADVRAAFWFVLQDIGGGLASDNAYGLRDRTGAPKPSYGALRYFTSLVSRADQFVGPLNLSSQSSSLEGYQFTAPDGRLLQIVWNETDLAAAPITYSPSCTPATVTDPSGGAIALASGASALMVNSEPRYIFCAPGAA